MSSPPKRAAIYGGTFDPIHHGHLILARDAMESLELDRVIFVPATISPHKLHAAPSAGAARREMLAAAIDGEPAFELDDLELRREGPSYTIDTVQAIRARLPACKLYFLIGFDNVAKLATWHRFSELQALVEFVVFDRERRTSAQPYHVLPRRLDISATEIRQRIAHGASIRYLVPDCVREFIEHHRLYTQKS